MEVLPLKVCATLAALAVELTPGMPVPELKATTFEPDGFRLACARAI